MNDLQRLRDKLDFANAATAELHVALDLPGFDDFLLDAIFHPADLAQETFVDGAGVTKRLYHLEELGAQRLVAGHGARLDEHHALPGLAPLNVIGFVTAERSREWTGITF